MTATTARWAADATEEQVRQPAELSNTRKAEPESSDRNSKGDALHREHGQADRHSTRFTATEATAARRTACDSVLREPSDRRATSTGTATSAGRYAAEAALKRPTLV